MSAFSGKHNCSASMGCLFLLIFAVRSLWN
uniref:Uncharacterized protein n=1 Tax=Arundo donax TaxID=35708 RepID=A0A0A9H5T4_ARUDO